MASAAVRAGEGSSAILFESHTRLKYSNNRQGVFMITAVSAIVAMLLVVAWAGMGRRAGQAIAGALACGAVIAGFTVVLGGDDRQRQ